MKKLFNKTTTQQNTKKNIGNSSKVVATKDYAGSYVCPLCGCDINFEGNKEVYSSHANNCPNNKLMVFKDDSSGMTFTLNENIGISKSLYSNIKLIENNNDIPISDFFNFSDNIYQKIVKKLRNSNFKIKNLKNNKTHGMPYYFHEVKPGIEKHLESDEKIYFGKVVVFEDIYHKSPVYRLSFSSLRKEKFQLRFKVYNNTQIPQLKTLYHQLTLIPSKYKKKVNNNNGSYSLGKAVFVQAKIIEKDGNFHFVDIKNIWLTDADNRYDYILENEKD